MRERVVEHIKGRDAASQHWHQTRKEPLTEFCERRCPLQFSRQRGDIGLDPPLLVHCRGALLEDVDRARQAAGFVRGTHKRDGLAVIAGGDCLDRPFQASNRLDDSPEREKSQQAGQDEGHRVGNEHFPAKPFDDRDGFLAGGRGRLLVMPDPFVGYPAETITQIGERALEERQRFCSPPLVREQHDLLGAGNPLAAECLEITEQPPVLVVEHQILGVLLQQTVDLSLVLIERGAGGGALRVVGREQMAAHVHAQLGETPGHIPQRGQRHDSRFRDEAAPLLDLCKLQASEDTEAQHRHERNREQDD